MILIAVISLGAIGAVGAVFLYAASKKFEVYEDPRIAQVQEVLPGANCGGCGYPGCAGFAGACVKGEMHHADGDGVGQLDAEVAVGNAIQAVGAGSRKAQLLGGELAVQPK